MALEEYKRKRDFEMTPEPEPAPKKSSSRRNGKLSYLIQKHDASRLHYDFRLELDGVLLSWAVTKGPSINPADKRLAVRTEDHPLDYGNFEGTIPQGQYGGGTVMLWDVGTWEPKDDPAVGLEKGHLSFILHGERLRGGWELVRMRGDEKRENWLLIKAKDQEARRGPETAGFLDEQADSVKTGRSMKEIADGTKPSARKAAQKRPLEDKSLDKLRRRYTAVQLATLVEQPPEGEDWVHEIKFDGYRLLGFASGEAVRLYTRNDKDWTNKFPTVVEAVGRLKAKDAVLDLEAVVLQPDGRSSFQALQAALGRGGDPSPIVSFVFDLLHLDGKDLTSLPLLERKSKLEKLLKVSNAGRALSYSEHLRGEAAAIFAKACEAGLEGVVSKHAEAPYEAGRQRSWLKSRCSLRQEFIILGLSDARTGERALGALYLGYRKGRKMQYAGKVGTGFSMEGARELAKRFASFATKKPVLERDQMKGVPAGEWKSIHWVEPKMLCEVEFTEWTNDGRIRHPSFQGLREDKVASEVKKEEPVPLKTTAKRAVSRRRADGLEVEGVVITHPDRVISETGKITKGDVAKYYAAVAEHMLPGIARHPLSLLRCPSGIDRQCFYQRNPGKGWGAEVHPFEFKHDGKTYEYLYVEDKKGLLQLIQMGSIEIHPWGAGIDSIDYPDRLIFDLDPAPDVPFEAVKLAAKDLRGRLESKGLESTLRCSGGKGLHVLVGLAGKDKWPEVKSFAGDVAKEMVAAVPDAYIATASKAKREGKIFIDYLRNDYTATAIADYSVRAKPGAPVAVPLDWKELDKLKSADQFSMKDVMGRLKRKGPVAAANAKGQRIPRSR